MKLPINLFARCVVSLLPAAFSTLGSLAATPGFYLHDGDHVVMYGDSITDQRLYTVFTEVYVTTHFPTMKVDWTDSGWSGDKVSGGGGGPIDVRLRRDVIAYHPSVVTVMLGMNDAGYRPYDQRLFDTYTTGYQSIISAIKTADPKTRLTVIEPSPYDDVTRPVGYPLGYNYVLQRYAQEVRILAAQNHVNAADMNSPVVLMLEKADMIDPVAAQKIIVDRVHPSAAGHLIMAEALLKSWNAPAIVTSVRIDAAINKVVRSENTWVTSLDKSSTISWTQLDKSLPMPLDFDDPLVALVLKSSDFIAALDQEQLQVTGLSDANYDLKIDGGDIGTFSARHLANGINLATISTPMLAQAKKVMDLTVKHNNLHFQAWRKMRMQIAPDATQATRDEALSMANATDVEEARTVVQQREAAQPVPHSYTLTVVK